MTDEQREKGRAITLALLVMIMLVGMCSSCSSLLYNSNRIVVTHVLALTNEGDTVKIKIQDIQPQRMYHVVGYDFVDGMTTDIMCLTTIDTTIIGITIVDGGIMVM